MDELQDPLHQRCRLSRRSDEDRARGTEGAGYDFQHCFELLTDAADDDLAGPYGGAILAEMATIGCVGRDFGQSGGQSPTSLRQEGGQCLGQRTRFEEMECEQCSADFLQACQYTDSRATLKCIRRSPLG